MLIELFIFFQLFVIALFFIAFFTKQEIIWALSTIFSAVLMFSSFDVQVNTYVFNNTIGAYAPIVVTYNYIYLSWINMIFLVLSVVLGLFDIFDKYGIRIGKKKEEKDE
jgi:lysylphosphatidylglycerol synthetase-like protein (DUF2156 family)